MSAPVLICPHRDISFGVPGPWQDSPQLALRDNVTGSEPEQGTKVRCAWSDKSLHVHFTCIDSDPWATITQRDGPLWEEEVVEIFIDPVGDLESYFEVEVNPLNTVLDIVLRKNRSGYRKDFAWDCDGLQTEVTRTTVGWNAEFLIPFASIVAEPPREGNQWRINFYRIDRPNESTRQLSAWSPTGQPSFHIPQRFGFLQFG